MSENVPAPEMTSVREQTRIYHFPHADPLVIENVVAFAAPRSTHRLECADGTRWIIPAGWIAIEIVGIDAWTR